MKNAKLFLLVLLSTISMVAIFYFVWPFGETVAFWQAKRILGKTVRQNLGRREKAELFNLDSWISKTKPIQVQWPPAIQFSDVSSSKFEDHILEYPSPYEIECEASRLNLRRSTLQGDNHVIISVIEGPQIGFEWLNKIGNSSLRSEIKQELLQWNERTLFDRVFSICNSDATGIRSIVPFTKRVLNLCLLCLKVNWLSELGDNGSYQVSYHNNSDIFIAGPLAFERIKKMTFVAELFPRGYPDFGLEILFVMADGQQLAEANNEVYSFLDKMSVKADLGTR